MNLLLSFQKITLLRPKKTQKPVFYIEKCIFYLQNSFEKCNFTSSFNIEKCNYTVDSA